MGKTYYIDIDGTICTNTDGDYESAVPFKDRIDEFNELVKDNHVVYWTSRGVTTGIDWTELTTKQLQYWGVKYHELRLGKPHYDIFICDKSVNPNE
jgi:hypothetical protein